MLEIFKKFQSFPLESITKVSQLHMVSFCTLSYSSVHPFLCLTSNKHPEFFKFIANLFINYCISHKINQDDSFSIVNYKTVITHI